MAESSRLPRNIANCPRNGNIASNALSHHYNSKRDAQVYIIRLFINKGPKLKKGKEKNSSAA